MEINRNNYEEFFLLYVDNELPAGERKAVEEFVILHHDLKEELDLLLETVLVPTSNVVFENKEELYKEEKERRIIAYRWWRMAAAAAVILFGLGTFGWLFIDNKETKQPAPVAVLNGNTIEESEQKNNANKETAPATTGEPTEGTTAPAIKETVVTPKKTFIDNKAVKEKPSTDVKTNQSSLIATAPVESKPKITVAPEIVEIEEPKAPIDIAVSPRKIDKEIKEISTHASYTGGQSQQPSKLEYVETTDDNIYFANTSVSKRNKLRGVFRKATRFIDKVTSLQ